MRFNGSLQRLSGLLGAIGAKLTITHMKSGYFVVAVVLMRLVGRQGVITAG